MDYYAHEHRLRPKRRDESRRGRQECPRHGFHSLAAQRGSRVDPRGLHGGNEAGRQGGRQQDRGGGDESPIVGRAHAEEESLDQTPDGLRAPRAQDNSGRRQPERFLQHQPGDLAAARAERHADADLGRSARDQEGQHAIQANQCQAAAVIGSGFFEKIRT
jgi:hypothetical protein